MILVTYCQLIRYIVNSFHVLNGWYVTTTPRCLSQSLVGIISSDPILPPGTTKIVPSAFLFVYDNALM
jgi:hypothetical protein